MDEKKKRIIPFDLQSLLPNESACVWALCCSPNPAMTSFGVYREIVGLYVGVERIKESGISRLQEMRTDPTKKYHNPLPSPNEIPGNEKKLRDVVAALKERGVSVPNVQTVSRILNDCVAIGWVMKRESIHSASEKKKSNKKSVYWLPSDVREKARAHYKQPKE